MVEIIDPELVAPLGALILVFAIVYGILTYANILKDRRVNLLIAAVFGLFSTLNEVFVTGLEEFLPIAAVVLVIVFFIMLLKEIVGKAAITDVVPVVVVLALLVLLVGSFGSRLPIGIANLDSTALAGWLALILVILIFWFAYRHVGTVGRSE